VNLFNAWWKIEIINKNYSAEDKVVLLAFATFKAVNALSIFETKSNFCSSEGTSFKSFNQDMIISDRIILEGLSLLAFNSLQMNA